MLSGRFPPYTVCLHGEGWLHKGKQHNLAHWRQAFMAAIKSQEITLKTRSSSLKKPSSKRALQFFVWGRGGGGGKGVLVQEKPLLISYATQKAEPLDQEINSHFQWNFYVFVIIVLYNLKYCTGTKSRGPQIIESWCFKTAETVICQ